MKELDIDLMFQDEDLVGPQPLIGSFPCHVISLKKLREVTDKDGDKNRLFELKVKIAPEAKTFNGDTIDEKTISAAKFVGYTVTVDDIWLSDALSGKMWKNRNYIETFENLGVTFPEGTKGKRLLEVEESDVLGKPCIGVTTKKVDWRDKGKPENERRMKVVVKKVLKWTDGYSLPLEDIIPF